MPNQHQFQLPASTDPLRIRSRGLTILNDPFLNKGTAFTAQERIDLGLSGLLPPQSADMHQQVMRVMENYARLSDPLDKYTYLISLADRNVTLFYRVLMENLVEMTPIMYTPTVGQACQKFGHIYRKNRGMYITLRHKGRIADVLSNWPNRETDIIVISDGSRILGLGDLGANGMGIPIGKLVLYVVGAGLHPNRSLPILLDVGTDNEELIHDPLYLGLRQPRVGSDEFDEIVDEFVHAAKARWPHVLIQWEDFTPDKSFPLLERYRENTLCFNDDIQGTGAVALSGLMAAMRIRKQRLSDQRIVFCGAGSANVGIADMICAGMIEEGTESLEHARQRFWMVDTRGLVSTLREGVLAAHKLPYARDDAQADSLLEVVRHVKPTILMGACGQPGLFTEEVIRTMHEYCEQPIVFALSNPTSKAECSAAQAYEWTDGKAIFASGSPFDPVRFGGRIFIPGQGNNMFIFPGMGLGAVACGATKITDEMFFAAARTLAHLVTDDELAAGTVYPDLGKIREISLAIATEVCRHAWQEGLASHAEPENIREHVASCMYQPEYRPYLAV